MRLNTLEIKGFKSFADKTTIHFNNGITGIVGPNGCGKSNVVDAIRWVLGEQKTSMLRLEKMDNLIFNGTKKRKASGLSEVSLTFENTKNVLATDYRSVTITRRLFRSGDSEYRLNDVPCRLKDISSLFMDTGVGSDSYAIIELGMVDEILNDRENSRRKLLEQAAGISKFKQRKKETLNKLKGTEADLERVEDLLHEIEGNLKTLESQARKAKRHKKLKEDYKELHLRLIKYKLEEHKETYKSLKQQLTAETDKKIEHESSLKQAESKLEKLKTDNLHQEKELSDLQKKLNELVGNVSGRENELNLVREKIKFNEERQLSAKKQLDQLADEHLEILQQIKLLDQQKNEATEGLEGKEAEVLALKAVLDKKNEASIAQKATIDTDRSALSHKEQNVFNLEKKLAVLNTQLESANLRIDQNKDDELKKQAHLDQLNSKKDSLAQNLKQLSEAVDELLHFQEKMESSLKTEQTALNKIEEELVLKRRTLDAKQNEYNLTKSLVDNLEGFPESIKFLKKNAPWKRPAPLLSDIIYCPEEYRIAIENYLELYLNYYVVERLEEAKKAIQLLNDSAIGRAGFLILEEFLNYKATKPIISAGQAATEIIEVEEKYQNLAAWLLEGVYLVEETNLKDLETSTSTGDLTLLTSSGKINRRKYRISGGAVGLFEGKKIGRARNLDKLKKEIKTIENQLTKLEKSKHLHLKEIQELEDSSKANTLSDLQQNLIEVKQQFQQLSYQCESLTADIQSASLKKSDLQQSIKGLNNDIKEGEEQLVLLRTERQALIESISGKDSAYASLVTELDTLRVQFSEQNLGFHQSKNKLEQIEKELQFKTDQQKREEQQRQQAEQTIELSKQEISNNKAQLVQFETELIVGYEDRETLSKKVNELEEIYYKGRGAINEEEKELREQHSTKEQQQQLVQSIEAKLNELKLSLAGVKERLSIEFGIDINNIINEAVEVTEDIEALEQQVVKIKNRLENFGEINPMAIEAYDEMKTRFDFIQTQRQDLLEAKEGLLETIDEIENTAKDKFLEAFVSVRENFKQVFRSLFTEEDSCDLVLTDELNPLESKIEIMARPKGKRPTVIDQLSGGEKTLTATALLFSLYLLKPAPFCIFDEVDAPLDDTNISKFNNIIRDFSKDSQFIIVTHNKQTMSHVDVIYGVTMAEQGVSRVVPVDFRQLN